MPRRSAARRSFISKPTSPCPREPTSTELRERFGEIQREENIDIELTAAKN